MASLVCPVCGAENPEGFRFCGFCAAALTESAAGRRRLATLVFCDLVGSTALGERVDPEPLQELMRAYFGEMRAAIDRHGGSVEKFIGDAVVGVFGVPVANEDDALRACRAALEMQGRLEALNGELERRYGARIAIRIGVNTGEVVGSRESFVTGDAVNVAARLEQAAGAGEVLLGEPTYRLVRNAVTAEAVEPIAAKGKSEPLPAYRLLAMAGARAASRPSTPIVGRERELALLEREFESVVAEGRCRLVTVVGEAGIGKSRLVAELAERVGSSARVVRGASYGEGITFWAIAQIVRDLAGIRDEQSITEARAQLDGLLEPAVSARVAQLIGLAEGAATADQLMLAIASFLSVLAAESPLVVLVDDIHWAEPALFDLLAALPGMVGEVPLLLCCLARPELLEARPEWPVSVRLEPLGETDITSLLESLDAPAEARERIVQAAAGNPLFAEELVAWLAEADADTLPTSLNALLGARLDRLDDQARDALERGAVEGELFHRGAVVELSDEQARPSVPDGLDELTGKDMIRPAVASFAGEVAFRFKHILVRDAAYRATAKRLRASLHERFADWLERLVGERVVEYEEILGYHFEQAYRYRMELGPADDEVRALATRAARHLAAAGRRANDRGDVYAAANLLGSAIPLLPVDSLERLELMCHCSEALRESGRKREAVATVEELYERAAALGERGLAAHACVLRANLNLFLDPDVSLDEKASDAEEWIETFTELGDEVGLAKAKRLLGMFCRGQGRQAEATIWFERALVHANACGDLFTRRAITQSLAMILPDGPMPVGDAIRRCEELRELNLDDHVLEAVITRCLSALYAMAGRFDEARECWLGSSRVLDAANMVTSSFISQAIVSGAKELAGDRAGAEEDLKARFLFGMRVEGGSLLGARQAAYQLVRLCCDDGRWDEAEEYLARFRDAPEQEGVNTDADRLAGEARLAAHHGRLGEAVTLAQRAVELVDPTDNLVTRARVWLALAEVQRAAGRAAEANAAVEAALALYEQKGNIAAAAALRAIPLT